MNLPAPLNNALVAPMTALCVTSPLLLKLKMPKLLAPTKLWFPDPVLMVRLNSPPIMVLAKLTRLLVVLKLVVAPSDTSPV